MSQINVVEMNGEKFVKVDSSLNDEIIVNGETYKKVNTSGARNRHVVVCDKGFIWAGDLKEDSERLSLERPVMLARWSDIWFSGAISEPESDNVTIVNHKGSPGVQNKIDMPKFSEIFRVPVKDNWGL